MPVSCLRKPRWLSENRKGTPPGVDESGWRIRILDALYRKGWNRWRAGSASNPHCISRTGWAQSSKVDNIPAIGSPRLAKGDAGYPTSQGWSGCAGWVFKKNPEINYGIDSWMWQKPFLYFIKKKRGRLHFFNTRFWKRKYQKHCSLGSSFLRQVARWRVKQEI